MSSTCQIKPRITFILRNTNTYSQKGTSFCQTICFVECTLNPLGAFLLQFVSGGSASGEYSANVLPTEKPLQDVAESESQVTQ